MSTYSDSYYDRNGRRRATDDPASDGTRQDDAAPASGARVYGSRGQVTSRPSRESILRSYAAQDAERARTARAYSQAVSQVYRDNSAYRQDRAANRASLAEQQREQRARWEEEARQASASRGSQGTSASSSGDGQRRPRPRVRVVPPLSSQESYDRTRSSMESYERARASRDAFSDARRARTLNREVIDGRGSIDSRAFNETHELVGYSIDDRDRPQATVDDSFSESRSRWHSRAGQGFSSSPDTRSSRSRAGQQRQRRSGVGFSGGVVSGRANYTAPRSGILGFIASLPLFLKIAIPVIIVLAIILIVLLTR